eukprot:4161549-Amphidinium_carterae.1
MSVLVVPLMPPLEGLGMKLALMCVCRGRSLCPTHIVCRCPHWHKERRLVELPADDATVPPCGLLSAPHVLGRKYLPAPPHLRKFSKQFHRPSRDGWAG